MIKSSCRTAILLTFTILVFGMFGCSSDTSQVQGSDAGSGQVELGSSVIVDDESEESNVAELTEISTSCGTLYYPAEWEDDLTTEEDSDDSSCRVTFSTEVDGSSYVLFTVCIGEAEGDSVGVLTDDGGVSRDVAVEVNDFGDISGLSTEDQDQLYAMQEGINDLIENLV